jgi:hypothetical protein
LRSTLLVGLASVAIAAGCDKVSKLAGQATEQAQQVVSNAVEEIKQTAGAAGSVELQLEQPVTAKCCYASLLKVNGRPTVLQVASYSDPSGESFPSFFLRATTEQSDLAALVGSAIPAEVYVQAEADGPIWHSTADQPAQIVIRSAAADEFAADLQGVLVNSGSGATREVTGKLSGSLK